jgi:hypothetical protein
LQLGVAVQLQQFRSEEDEAVRVVERSVDTVGRDVGSVGEGGSADVVFEELDIDAVQSD